MYWFAVFAYPLFSLPPPSYVLSLPVPPCNVTTGTRIAVQAFFLPSPHKSLSVFQNQPFLWCLFPPHPCEDIQLAKVFQPLFSLVWVNIFLLFAQASFGLVPSLRCKTMLIVPWVSGSCPLGRVGQVSRAPPLLPPSDQKFLPPLLGSNSCF